MEQLPIWRKERTRFQTGKKGERVRDTDKSLAFSAARPESVNASHPVSSTLNQPNMSSSDLTDELYYLDARRTPHALNSEPSTIDRISSTS
jgi:hypothetical protein